MTTIKSFVDPRSATFRANAEAYAVLLDDLRTRLAQARAGGPLEARERHTARGKLLVRERIERLLDPATPFSKLGRWQRTRSMMSRFLPPVSSPASGASPGAR